MPYLNVEGVSCYFEEARGTEGTPLVCVHGWGGGWQYFQGTVKHFQDKWRVIVPSLPDLDQWEKFVSEKDSISSYADWLFLFLRELGLEKVVLMGHSMGGMIATRFALSYQDRLKGLILVNTPIRGRKVLSPTWQLSSLPVLKQIFLVSTRIGIIRSILGKNLYYQNPIPKELVHGVGKVPFKILDRDLQSLGNTDLSERLREIQVPSLVMGGEKDQIIRPEEFPFTATSLPNATYHPFKDTGHVPMAEIPDVFHEVLTAYLRQL